MPAANVVSDSRALLSWTVDVREEVVEIFARLLLGLALLELRAVGGHHVPARAAGGERVRRDDLDAVLRQIVPALDPLRVPVANHEDDDGVGDHALVLAARSSRAPTMSASTRRVMSGSSENATTSARRPASTARLCSPEAPNDWSNSTPSPDARLVEVDQLGVRLARRRVGDEANVAAVGPASAASSDEEPPHPARARAANDCCKHDRGIKVSPPTP